MKYKIVFNNDWGAQEVEVDSVMETDNLISFIKGRTTVIGVSPHTLAYFREIE